MVQKDTYVLRHSNLNSPTTHNLYKSILEHSHHLTHTWRNVPIILGSRDQQLGYLNNEYRFHFNIGCVEEFYPHQPERVIDIEEYWQNVEKCPTCTETLYKPVVLYLSSRSSNIRPLLTTNELPESVKGVILVSTDSAKEYGRLVDDRIGNDFQQETVSAIVVFHILHSLALALMDNGQKARKAWEYVATYSLATAMAESLLPHDKRQIVNAHKLDLPLPYRGASFFTDDNHELRKQCEAWKCCVVGRLRKLKSRLNLDQLSYRARKMKQLDGSAEMYWQAVAYCVVQEALGLF